MGSFIAAIFGLVFVCLMVVGGLWGCPQYNVYQKRLSGEAQLAEAESNRQIAIREANAKFESAGKLAAADTLRAWGVRRSNEIIAEGLGGPEGYLRYLFIQTMESNPGKVIYVPTEAGIPIMEAGKR